jgi:cytochrome P450
MSATSFGGSFNLVVSNDSELKDMFIRRLARAAIDAQFPFLKHVPFVPPTNAKEMNIYIDRIIDKRRKEIEAGEPVKKDLVQILVDTHNADPTGFSNAHIREEMMLFMLVFFKILVW